MKIYMLIIFWAMYMISCIPEDDPVSSYNRGDATVASVDMGSYYEEQIYFSLDNNTIVAKNKITDWDIAFSSDDNYFEIILNNAKFMKAAELEDTEFDSINGAIVQAIPADKWKYDNSKGKRDSTAIGQWWRNDAGKIVPNNSVYIIDRGIDEKTKKLGTAKFQIVECQDDIYTVKFAKLSDNITYTAKIKKDNLRNYSHFSFDNEGKQLILEPLKNQWDIIFTKYTQLLYTDTGDELWYSVTGVYLNPNNVRANIIHGVDFANIGSKNIDSLSFTNERNIIGHTWKNYDMNTGTYEVDDSIIYLIYGVNEFYYKLHFLDFYEESGNKGSPSFEFQKI